jgi:hypothetical protein
MSLWPLAAAHTHMFLVEQGKYADADQLGAEIRTRAEEMSAIHALVVLNANTAVKYYEMGDYPSCRQAAELALMNVERSESLPLKLSVLGILGLCALEQGHRNEAFTIAQSAITARGPLQVRLTDSSYLEILLSRVDMLKTKPAEAIDRLRSALEYYADGDVVCRLRIQCELARVLKTTDRNEARRHAKEVYEKARAIGARPLADRADSLLHRL